jgi:hypothetical protein
MIPQNPKMLSFANEKHAVRKEMDLSRILVMYLYSLHNACKELKKPQASQDHDTDSSETWDAKCHVQVLQSWCSNTIQLIENHTCLKIMDAASSQL